MADIEQLHARASQCVRAGDHAGAAALLDTALQAAPEHPGLLFTRAVVAMSLRRFDDALRGFSQVLRIEPAASHARFHRALLLSAQERSGEALEDFIALTQSRPETVEPWANAGVLLLRMERYPEAIGMLRRALTLSPQQPQLLRSLANALRGQGALEESLHLHAQVATLRPDDPAALTDHALALLGAGQAAAAQANYRRALQYDPTDRSALAGLYLTATALGDSALAQQLMDYPRLLSYAHASPDDALDRDALRAAVLGHPGLVWQPVGRSTHQGQQSPMLDLSPGSAFATFGRMLERVVGTRLQQLRADTALQSHPWMRGLPARWRLQAWCTVLAEGGRQSPHIHPAGWLSGVYYLDAGAPTHAQDGNLTFGHPPDEIPPAGSPRLIDIQPQNDLIVCFPSYFFHNTTPFHGARARISLAFDVLPLA